MVYLSIIIPAYNEEARIAGTLSKIYDFLKTKNYTYEVIVVDDGSSDMTVDTIEKSILANEDKLKIIRNGINRGKGFSVKSGIVNSAGEYILFSDTDLSTPIEEVDKLFDEINKGYDVAIGSRNVKGSRVVLHQPWYRELMGKTFNLIVKALLLKEFNDTQCGFKLFRGDIAGEIAKTMRIDRFAFDVEMLYIARMKHYKIKEKGVRWENSPESKVKVLRSTINMFFDLFKIKVLHHKLSKE